MAVVVVATIDAAEGAMSDDGDKKPDPNPAQQTAAEARRAMINQAIAMLSSALVTQVNATAMVIGMQPSRLMLAFAREGLNAFVNIRQSSALPPDVMNDINVAKALVTRIDEYIERQQSRIILPKNSPLKLV